MDTYMQNQVMSNLHTNVSNINVTHNNTHIHTDKQYQPKSDSVFDTVLCLVCFSQLFREVRIMKMLNHPNIGESHGNVTFHSVVTHSAQDLIGVSRSCIQAKS